MFPSTPFRRRICLGQRSAGASVAFGGGSAGHTAGASASRAGSFEVGRRAALGLAQRELVTLQAPVPVVTTKWTHSATSRPAPCRWCLTLCGGRRCTSQPCPPPRCPPRPTLPAMVQLRAGGRRPPSSWACTPVARHPASVWRWQWPHKTRCNGMALTHAAGQGARVSQTKRPDTVRTQASTTTRWEPPRAARWMRNVWLDWFLTCLLRAVQRADGMLAAN